MALLTDLDATKTSHPLRWLPLLRSSLSYQNLKWAAGNILIPFGIAALFLFLVWILAIVLS